MMSQGHQWQHRHLSLLLESLFWVPLQHLLMCHLLLLKPAALSCSSSFSFPFLPSFPSCSSPSSFSLDSQSVGGGHGSVVGVGSIHNICKLFDMKLRNLHQLSFLLMGLLTRLEERKDVKC